MDKQSKTALLIAFGLVGAFILGAMTATAGIAMTRVAAGVLSGGPGFVHGGPHTEMGPSGACDPRGQMLDGPRGQGPGMRGLDEEWRGKGGWHGQGEDGRYDEDKQEWFEEYHPQWDGDHPRPPFFDEDGRPVDPEDMDLDEDAAYPEDARNRETCPVWGTF